MKLTATHTSALAATATLALLLLAKMFAQPPGLLIFSVDGSGRGQGAILRAGTGQVANPDHPTKAGEAVEIYLTGLLDELEAGQLEECPAVRACDAAGVEVTVGDVAVRVLYFGRPPQLSGSAQLNVLIPEGVAAGPLVPVSVRAAGKQSNLVTLALQ